MENAGTPMGPFDGIDLETLFFRQMMNDSRIPPQIALRIVAGLCARVHAAHVRKSDTGKPLGVFHGTIAMPVVLVGRDGSVQVMKVPDGISIEQAPEQAAGGPGSQRGDIFNAGMVLYVLLTGEHPLLRETETETREAVLACVLPPPSTLANLSPSLDPVVMRAVAKDPNDRYPDMRAMQAAIEQALEIPGMGATAAEVGALVDAMAPRGEENLERMMGGVDPDEVIRVAERLAKQIRGSDARSLEATAALRAVDLTSQRPKIEVDCYFVDEGQAPAAASSRDALALYAQLERLGFHRLGVKVEVEKVTGNPVHSVCFSSAAHQTFASIFFSFDAVPSLYFLSHFEDGCVVLTSGYARETTRKPRAVHSGLPGKPLAEVLATHLRELEAFKAKGSKLGTDWGQQARVRSTHLYYENPDTR